MSEAAPAKPRAAGGAMTPLTPTLVLVIVGIGYYMAARLSLLLQVQPENIAVFWPASGLAAGALIALGRDGRIPVAAAVVIATFAANVEHGAQPLVAALFGACNALECLLVARILAYLPGFPFQFDSLRRVFGFIVAALLATAIAALPAAATLVHVLGVPVPFWTLWRVWLESDVVGVVTVAPLLIALPAALRDPLPALRMIEGAVILIVLAVSSVYVFSHLPTQASWPTVSPLGMLIPLLLWLAVRCPPIFAASGSLAVALTIAYCVTNGLGALGQATQPLADRILASQGAMLTLALCALAFSALIAGQRNVEALLRTKEQRLRIASAAAGLGVFEWHIKEDRAVWENERMFHLFGLRPTDGALSFSDVLEHYLDPADKDRVIADSQRSMVAGSVDTVIRIKRKDGAWRDIEIIGVVERDGSGAPERVVGVMADITERRRIDEHQLLLIGELDHRVKNALERVATLILSTRRGAADLDTFAEALTGRIHSMARAHQLLSREHWSGVELEALVTEQLAAFAEPGRIGVEGPRVKLTDDATQALSMVLHELATNAAKYGALSAPGGRVQVGWGLDSANTQACGGGGAEAGRQLVIDWIETGGPTVKPPTRSGFGAKVIREPIVYELGGKVDLDFAAAGVRCRISVPVGRVAAG